MGCSNLTFLDHYGNCGQITVFRAKFLEDPRKITIFRVEKCKDDQMLYHMAFNWQPYSNDIKLIRRELIKNPNFFPQLKIKLLQHIAPFDVHNKKRMYKHPQEYDSKLEKNIRKMIF